MVSALNLLLMKKELQLSGKSLTTPIFVNFSIKLRIVLEAVELLVLNFVLDAHFSKCFILKIVPFIYQKGVFF